MIYRYENVRMEQLTEPTITPLTLAMFRDDWRTLRRLAEQAHKNIVHWVEYDTGGHYAAHQVPELFVGDVRKFFRSLHR